MNRPDRDMDDEETLADRRLVFLSPRYNDPRLPYIEENEEEEG